MARYLLPLALFLPLLLFLWLRPGPAAPPPVPGVRLQGVEFWLFPEEEGVQWRFRAEEMVEEGGVFRIRGGLLGERYVEGRLDLRLKAPEVVVEPGDNLRAPYAEVEILKGCYRLALSAPGKGEVLIRQKEGFFAPWVRIEAPNLRGEAEAFRSDFALERLEAQNPRFSFPAGGSFGPCTVEGGSS
ncbi:MULTISPECIES: hypothetical protein [Thermus]|uniref:Uncharacterized protein n=1 Tax=Thermus brockianus TaxID=56956 RepID=A0A1J0LRP7_THEBO|nr:hypothetical protein [Thermus brockianus]APD08676.1 hypothetical protein A0O31_00468 [Thermus brockianus]BDG15965.1 hypothetical protein TbrSNM41_06990 [Thermus brockianus]